MKHSKLFCAFGLIICLASCNNKSNKTFTLEGSIENASDSVIYLMASSDSVQIDTVRINNGKFSYRKELNEATVYMINFGASYAPGFFIAEPGITKLQFDYNSMNRENSQNNENQVNFISDVLKIDGGENQKRYKEFQDLCKPYFMKMDSIKEIASLNENNNEKLIELNNAFLTVDQDYKTMQKTFIKGNSSYPVAAFVGNNYLGEIMEANEEDAQWVYAQLKENVRTTFYGKKINKTINKLSATKIGAIAPEFRLPDLSGDSVSRTSVKAKITFIDFWASWCMPCRQFNPSLVKLYNQFHPKGLEIIGVSLDKDKDDCKLAITKDQLAWVQLIDQNGWGSVVASTYNVQQIPSNYLLDADGKIIGKNLGLTELSDIVQKALQ